MTRTVKVEPAFAQSSGPDPKHIYAIELNSGFFEDMDLDVGVNEQGVIGAAAINVIVRTSDIAVGVASTVIKGIFSRGDFLKNPALKADIDGEFNGSMQHMR